MTEAALAARFNGGLGVNGHGTTPSEVDPSAVDSKVPLLTYGEEVDSLTFRLFCYFIP